MKVYFVVFLIAFAFSLISEYFDKKDKRFIALIFILLALFVPSFMAGIRQSGVGTDTKVYIDWIFRASIHLSNIKDVVLFSSSSGVEFLYCIINYFISRFSNNLTVIYFFLELIILFFSFFGIKKMSKIFNVSYSFCYLIFLLLFFNKSLNMCRQSIAMSICLFSITYIIDRDWKKYFLFMLLGYGFHRSIIVFLPLYFVYPICVNYKKESNVVKLLIVFTLLLGCVFFKQIVVLLTGIGLISNKYLNYVYVFGTHNNIKIIELFSEIGVLVVSLFLKSKLVRKNSINNFLIFVVLISFLTFLFGYNASYAQRISYYFSIVLVILIPQVTHFFTSKKDIIFISIILTLILCIYSSLYYGKYNFDQTVPYVKDTGVNKIVK